MLQPPNGWGPQHMQYFSKAAPHSLRQFLLELEHCGFQPLGIATQGSGVTGSALSADGMTWAALHAPPSGLRGSWRELIGTGELRGAGCAAQFTTIFNNGERLVTRGAELPAGTALAELARHHFRRLDAWLLRRHPLKALIHCDGTHTPATMAQPKAAPQPLSVAGLRQHGVPAHLARLIAGDCAEALAR
jgi:hypothetical protein